MSDLTLSVRLTADGKGLVEVVGQGADAFDHFGDEANRAGAASKKSGSDLKSLGNESKSLSDHLFSLKTLMGTVASVMLSNQALRMADDYKLLQGRIKLATESTGDYVAVSEKLYAITQNNGAALEGSVGLFQSLARSAPELKATNDEVLTLTKLIQQTGVVSGASTQAMSAGMLQFGQAMAGGVVHAEEFNSLLENMPELANQIAAGMGLTSGQLRLAVNDGKILSEDVFRVLLGQSDEVQRKFDAMPVSIERSGEMLKSSVSRLLAEIDKSVGATGSLASGLQSVSQWMDRVSASDIDEMLQATAVIVTALSTAIATRYVISLAAATLAQIQSSRAATGMSAALGVQTTMTTAQATANVALATSARVAGTAMAFLGGPAGIIIASVAALGVYVATSRDAANETEALTTSTNKLAGSMGNVASVGVSKQIEVTKGKIAEVNLAIQGFESNIARMRSRTDGGAKVGIAFNQDAIEKEKAKLLELNQQMKGLEETKARIAGLNTPGGPKPKKEDDGLEKEYEAVRKSLFSQEAALADSYQRRAETTVLAQRRGLISEAERNRQLLELEAQYQGNRQQLQERGLESAEAYGKRQFELARQAFPDATQSAQPGEEYGQQQAAIAQQMLEQQKQLRESLYSPTEALDASYQSRAEQIASTMTDEEERTRMLLTLEQQYQDEKERIQEAGMTAEQKLWASGWQGKVAVVSGAVSSIAQFLMTGNKRQFEIGKMLARGSIIADTARGIMKAWGEGPILGPILAVAVAAQGALQLRNLNATQFGGGGSVGSGGSAGVGSAIGAANQSNYFNQNLGQPSRTQQQGGVFQLIFNGPVYGIDQFEEAVVDITKRAVEERGVLLVSSNSYNGQELIAQAAMRGAA